MPARVNIVDRIICTVCIQVPSVRVAAFAAVGILREESSGAWVVESCVQIQQSGPFIVDGSGIPDLVLEVTVCTCFALTNFAEITIPIGYHTISVLVQYIYRAASLVFGVEIIRLASVFDPAGRKRIRYIEQIEAFQSSCAVGGVKHTSVLIEVIRYRTSLFLLHSLAVSVIQIRLRVTSARVGSEHACRCICVGLYDAASTDADLLSVSVIGIGQGVGSALCFQLIQAIIVIGCYSTIFHFLNPVADLIVSIAG